MRKTIILSLILLSWLPMLAVSDSKALKNILELSEEVNSICPFSVGENLIMREMKFNKSKNNLNVIIGIRSDYMVDFNSSPETMGPIAKNIISNWLTDNRLKNFVNNLGQVDATVSVHLLNLNTNKDQIINITSQQIQQVIAENPTVKDVSGNILQTFINNERLHIGTEASPGLEIIDVIDNGDNIEFISKCDESIFNMDELKNNLTPDLMEQIILDMISDPLVMSEMKCFAENGRGVKYSYIGADSGKRANALLPSSRLYSLTH
ncbi:MAG: hypothetical protein K2J15_04070 [Muribaculaceae bacterium]|nr:hypothetical protein [Muribaculaceae bacterium]